MGSERTNQKGEKGVRKLLKTFSVYEWKGRERTRDIEGLKREKVKKKKKGKKKRRME